MDNIPFKYKYSLRDRILESKRVLEKYPNRIPIICEKCNSSMNNYHVLNKNKYLVEREMTLGQFLYVIRARLRLPSEKALFLIIKNKIPTTTELLGELYEKNKHEDGFLYINYSFESVFGK